MAEEVKLLGKYETELKWTSYYSIGGFALSFLLYCLSVYFLFSRFYFNEDTVLPYILVIFLGFFLYLFWKCLNEIRQIKAVGFLGGLVVFFRMFVIVLLFNSIVGAYDTYYPYNFKVYNQDTKLVFDDREVLPDNRKNYLKDFISFIKKRRK